MNFRWLFLTNTGRIKLQVFHVFLMKKTPDPFACFLVEKTSFPNDKLRVSLIKAYCVGFFSIKKRKVQPSPFCTWYTTSHYQSLPVPNQKTTQPMFKVFRSTSTSPLSLSSGATNVLIRQGTCLRSEALKSRKLPPNGLQKRGGSGFQPRFLVAAIYDSRAWFRVQPRPEKNRNEYEMRRICILYVYCVYMYLTMIQYMLTGFFPNIKVLWWCLPDAQSDLPKVETIG